MQKLTCFYSRHIQDNFADTLLGWLATSANNFDYFHFKTSYIGATENNLTIGEKKQWENSLLIYPLERQTESSPL